MPKKVIYTIGHSTHPIEEFINILKHYGITMLVDIRTIPKSRYNPQFNQDSLSKSLEKAGIKYNRIEELGGFRHAKADSINTGWHNASFRGYADYMQTEQFRDGLDQLINYSKDNQIAIMCSEAVPWRCHRSLVGDALLVRGFTVEDIFSLTEVKPHKLTPWAHVKGDIITYPASADTEKDKK